jgi:transposase
MVENETEAVRTKPIGFAPILDHYFKRAGIAEIIDANVDLDPRRKILTHGEACVAMVTAILFQVLQLYRLCKFAEDSTVLETVLPGIASGEYFDDRLADTLDAVFDYGLGNLETLITRKMIEEFEIENDVCHNDTTSASVYGDCDNRGTEGGVRIAFGYSKKHRQDLKQLVWSLSVSGDHAFPLFQQAYDGNTSDVETYVEQWHNLIDLLGREDFLYVCDSKLVTFENMASIAGNGGRFLAPAPMYETYRSVFAEAIANHDSELLIEYKGKFNRGFETPLEITHGGKEHRFRMIVLFDHGLFKIKKNSLEGRKAETEKAFEELGRKLNKYKLKTENAIEGACESILKKYKTGGFFDYDIVNEPITVWKNAKRGRSKKNEEPPKTAERFDNFRVEPKFDGVAYEKELSLCGYYPLITNKPGEEFSMEEAMRAHKDQYKVEHTNRRAKGSYNLEPVRIHTPKRIESFLFLFKIALQIVVLIERTARRNIGTREKGLDGFMPNRKDVRNPKTEYLLAEFQYVVKGEIPLPNGNCSGFVSELTELQKDILQILEVPASCFTYSSLFGPFGNSRDST